MAREPFGNSTPQAPGATTFRMCHMRSAQASEDKMSFAANFPVLERAIIPLKKMLGSPKVKGGQESLLQ